jgi:hypothetical protein
MGRLHHLKQTFATNPALINAAKAEWVILDYNSPDGLEEWMRNKDGILYAKTTRPEFYVISHPRNVAALLTHGDIICNLDADNFLSKEFVELLGNLQVDQVVCGPTHSCATGRVGIYRKDFIRLGGYDERMEGWGQEDVDLVQRCERSGLAIIKPPKEIFECVPHPNEERSVYMANKDIWQTYRQNRIMSEESLRNNCLIANQGRTWGKEKVTINFKCEMDVGYGLE